MPSSYSHHSEGFNTFPGRRPHIPHAVTVQKSLPLFKTLKLHSQELRGEDKQDQSFQTQAVSGQGTWANQPQHGAQSCSLQNFFCLLACLQLEPCPVTACWVDAAMGPLCSAELPAPCPAASPVSCCHPLPPVSCQLPFLLHVTRRLHTRLGRCDGVVPLIILISTSALPRCQQQLKEKLQRTKLIICSSAAHEAPAGMTPKAIRAARCRKHLLPSDSTVTSLPALFYICALPD